MKIRYPSMVDMTNELDKLNSIIERLKGVRIVEITHSSVIISDGKRI